MVVRLTTPDDPPRPLGVVCWSKQENQQEQGSLLLFLRSNQTYGPDNLRLLLWGTPKIYDTVEDAIDSLDQEAAAAGYVRLVHALTNDELRTMCLVGKEFLRSRTAQLYIQISASCPAFYAKVGSPGDPREVEIARSDELRPPLSYDRMAKAWACGSCSMTQDTSSVGCPFVFQVAEKLDAREGEIMAIRSAQVVSNLVVTPNSTFEDFQNPSGESSSGEEDELEDSGGDEDGSGAAGIGDDYSACSGDEEPGHGEAAVMVPGTQEANRCAHPIVTNGKPGRAEVVAATQEEEDSSANDHPDKENSAAPTTARKKSGSESGHSHGTRASSRRKRAGARPSEEVHQAGGSKKSRRVLAPRRNVGNR